ncbi:MAG: hypothetical protein ABFS18_08515 [Thermodesulfobacteriota bacterium]
MNEPEGAAHWINGRVKEPVHGVLVAHQGKLQSMEGPGNTAYSFQKNFE